MDLQNRKTEGNSARTFEKSLWQEHITMPNIRYPSCPDYKTFSIPLKEAGKGRPLEEMWDQHRAKRIVGKKKVTEVDDFNKIRNYVSSVYSSTIKSQMAQIDRHVQLGLKAASDDLSLKKNKLRALIAKEEIELTHEYIAKAQEMAEELYERKKTKAEAITASRKKEQEDQARIAREMLFRNNSEEFREYVSKTLKLEAAETQKQQICEKMLQKDRDKQYERFWLEIGRKQDEEKKNYEEQEAIIEMTKKREQREILNKQIMGKKIMHDEIKQIKSSEKEFLRKLDEMMKEDDAKEKEFMNKQKLELKLMRFEELEDTKKLKKQRAEEEKAFDEYYCKKNAEEIEIAKKTQRDMRAEQKREADFFIQQLKEINEAKLYEEKQIDALREREVAKKDELIIRNKKMMKEAQEKALRETLETVKQQIIHKQKALEAEKEVEKLSNQWSQMILNKNIELDKMLNDDQKQAEINRMKDLDSQIEYNKHVLAERKIVEDEANLKYKLNELKLAEDIRKNETCTGSIHPFTKILLKN